jgi:hypothetical protein
VPKIVDLGAARDIDSGEQTQTGAVIGSAHYMPIEQAAGRKDIDLRVDIYAIGVLLYLLLTRKRPYENDETGVAMAKVLQGAPFASPREIAGWIPVELEQAVLLMLSRDRAQRPSSALEVIEMLNAVRPLCVGAQLPPPVRERHVTAGISISQPASLPEPHSIRSRVLPAFEPQSASVAHGMTAPVMPSPKPRRSGVIATIGAGVLLLGAGAFGVYRQFIADGGAAAGPATTQHAGSTPETPEPARIDTPPPRQEVDASSQTALGTVDETPVRPASDAAVSELVAAAVSDAATAPNVEGAPGVRVVRQRRVAPRESARCVPRPGIPCL